MQALANLPIRAKLAGFVLVSTFLSLGTGFVLVIITSVDAFKEEMMLSTRLVARVVGDYNAIALYFDDPTEARLSLARLGEIPYITDAYIFDASQRLFADYSRSGEPHPPQEVMRSASYIEGGFVHSFQPIVHEGVRYGTIYLRGSTAELDLKIRSYVTYMVILMLVLIVAALIFAYLLQGFISRPILKLAEAAQQISSRNDYSLRVEKPGQDEIGVLYDGFNAMLAQIHKRQQQLERSNRDLDQFAYVASHDLKAPLRAITTLSGWIEKDLADKLDDQGREQMQLLRNRVQRMDALINGILQYSRVGRIDTRGERVAVAPLVREVVQLLDPKPGFRVDVADDMPTLFTHRLRLEQVFSNLISNAIKYHDRSEGRIEVGWRLTPEGLHEFRVADDGPGIPPEFHGRIFKMFQTLEPGESTESTGLGLSLVKKLVEDEGGSIHVESFSGRGACFRFTWPEIDEEVTETVLSVRGVETLRSR